jgi:thiosulfate dehydrogenase
MNCQNCHLDAGTRPWGNNYRGVASTYPKYRERSGTVESIEKKINDCLERSLNGLPLDSNSKEMRAMVAYMIWVGADVSKGQKPKDAGIAKLTYLHRAADPVKGKMVYEEKCGRCHGNDGYGFLNKEGTAFIYPPLWGNSSYNSGAGIYRLSKFAGYVKDNMPYNEATHENPKLTDEECWDVAAFVNSQPRPGKDISADWPDVTTKPVDHPFGPFADSLSEYQHKYGPFR